MDWCGICCRHGEKQEPSNPMRMRKRIFQHRRDIESALGLFCFISAAFFIAFLLLSPFATAAKDSQGYA